MTRLVPVSLAAAIALLAATLQAALGPLYGGLVRLEVADLPETTAPSPHGSAAPRWPLALIHETLVTVDEDGRLRPRLATGWVSAADDREWTLTLADGLVFHDGRALTSADAVRSLRRFLRSGSPAAELLASRLDGGAAYRAGKSESLPGLDATEPGHVVLRGLTRDPRLLVSLAAPAAAVTSPQGAGAGPFAPTLWTTKGATLTAFTGHVHGRPLLDEVQLTLAGTGGADLRNPGPPGWTLVSSGASTLLLILDPQQPPFDAPAARFAVSGAIDSSRLVQHFLRRGVATRSLLPAVMALGAISTEKRPPPGRVEGGLTLAVSTEVPPLVSQRVVAHLSALGLTVQALPMPPDDATHGKHAARLVLASPEVSDRGFALFELALLAGRTGGPARRILDAASALSGEARTVELSRAEHVLLATHTIIPLAAVPVEVHARPGLFGARIDGVGVLHLDDAWRAP